MDKSERYPKVKSPWGLEARERKALWSLPEGLRGLSGQLLKQRQLSGSYGPGFVEGQGFEGKL